MQFLEKKAKTHSQTAKTLHKLQMANSNPDCLSWNVNLIVLKFKHNYHVLCLTLSKTIMI